MNPVASEAMALAGRRETVDWVERNARERLHPSLRDPSYLVLSRRRKILARWLRAVGVSSPSVLDVGGRIQPYRTLIPEPIRQYVAVDILNSPLVNIRASASALPFGSDTFDIVFCTQVLEYLPRPDLAALEIYRVLKPKGLAFFSVAAFYPRAVDEEHWRFLPAGLRSVLQPFREVEIVPEGTSISGFFRACCVCLSMFAKYRWLHAVVNSTAVPVFNLFGTLLEGIAHTHNDQAAGNYSVLARK
jgi:SAM-dependent methyltransferase